MKSCNHKCTYTALQHLLHKTILISVQIRLLGIGGGTHGTPTAQFVIGASYMNDLAFLSTGMDEVYNLGPSGEGQAMYVHVGVRRWSKHCSFSGSWTGA